MQERGPPASQAGRMTAGYAHGHWGIEHARLVDRARAVANLLHHDTCYPAVARVLEAGCGVGAQTVELVRRSPAAEFVSIDISAESLERARRRVGPHARVRFERADVLTLPGRPDRFDHRSEERRVGKEGRSRWAPCQ